MRFPQAASSVFLTCALVSVAWGEDPATPKQVDAEKKKVQASRSLTAADKAAVTGVLDEASKALTQEADWNKQVAERAREVAAAKAQLEAAKKELDQPPPKPAIQVPPGAKLSELEQRLAEAEVELKAADELITQLERERDQAKELGAQLVGLIKEPAERLKQLETELKAPLKKTPMGRAVHLRLRSRRQAAAAELQARKKAVEAFEARKELIPSLILQATRRKRLAEQHVEAWRQWVASEREAQAEADREQAERLKEETREQFPWLKELAEDIEELAELRSGTADTTGTSTRRRDVEAELTLVQKELGRVREEFKQARRRVRAAGMNNSMGILLRRQYDSLPDVSELRRQLERRREEIADLQLQLIIREDQRTKMGDVELLVSEVIDRGGESTPARRRELEATARELLQVRKSNLDALLEDYDKLLARLVELNTATRLLIRATEEYQAYIEERILWVPSVTGSAIPDPEEMGEGATWLLGSEDWGAGFSRAGGEVLARWWEALLGVMLIVALLASRLWSRGRVAAMASVVERSEGDSFGHTARAFAMVLGRSLVFPAVLYGFGWALAAPADQTAPALAAAAGLQAAAFALFAFELLRQVLLPNGLAEAHFRWPKESSDYIRWHLRWFIPIRILATFVVVAMETQQQDVLWNDALGRAAFIIDNVALTVFLQRVLRPSGPVFARFLQDRETGWSHRLSYPAYLLAVSVPLVLVLLSLRGYYYTSLRLEERLSISLWLVLALVLAQALFHRALRVARRRLVLAEAEEAAARAKAADLAAAPDVEERPAPVEPDPFPAPAGAGETEPGDDGTAREPTPEESTRDEPGREEPGREEPVREEPGDERREGEGPDASVETPPETDTPDRLAIPEVDAQTQQIFRSAVFMAVVLGFFFIWADVLPALKRLDQFTVWPSFGLQSTEDDDPLAQPQSGAVQAPAPQTATAKEKTLEEKPTAKTGASPARATDEDEPSAGPSQGAERVVTLADVSLGLLILVFTTILAKNVPGLLEILLLGRLPLDAGSRYAVSTMARYVILLVGIPVGLSTMGLRWDSIQWLVAALTFGLAFGLQEIFANFVSGLIILFERPVRVGDVVTVAGTTGTVTRIRMRATTITDFDQKELIVPNKQFVTGSVLNWALSNDLLRVVIPVGVGYGSDIDQAQQILIEEAQQHDLVLKEPAPAAWFTGLGDSVLNLELRVFVAPSRNKTRVQHDLLKIIHERFAREGLEIAFPQQDLHLRSAVPITLVQPDRKES